MFSMQRLQKKKRKEFLPTYLHLVRNFLLIYRTSSTLLAFHSSGVPGTRFSVAITFPGNKLKFHIEY